MERVAKADQEMFKQLICHANDAVDRGELNVVFVSSEGHVLPLLSKQSEKSRSGVIIHLGDVDLDQAESFLRASGFDKSLAKPISQLTSGRLIYLKQAVTVKNQYFYSSTNELKMLLLNRLYRIARSDVESARICAGEKNFNAKRALLEQLPASTSDAVERLVELGLPHDEAQDIIQEVLSANLIRLDGNVLKINTEIHHQYVQNYYRRYTSINLNIFSWLSSIFSWK